MYVRNPYPMPHIIYHWFVNVLARVFESYTTVIEHDNYLKELLDSVRNGRSASVRYQGIFISFDAQTRSIKFECTSEAIALEAIESLEGYGQRNGSLVSVCVPKRLLPVDQNDTVPSEQNKTA